MNKRTGRTRLRAQHNKKKIYHSAMGLFAQFGYYNVTIDQITSHAGVSKGTFYNYFRSKDELFLIYSQALEEQFSAFYRSLTQDDLYHHNTGLQKLYIMAMYMMHTMEEAGREFTALSHARQLRNEHGSSDVEDTLHRCARDIFPGLLTMGVDDGSAATATDIPTASRLLYMHLAGLVYEWECNQLPGGLTQGAAATVSSFCRMISPPQIPS